MSHVFKNCGAFFIKRSGLRFPKVYRAYLAEYIDYVLQSGRNIEFFIEGTRSRTGKVLPPKFGILKYICESFLNGSVRNALIVPITINYENVVEVGQLTNEWLGRTKKKESLGQLIRALGIINAEFGDIFLKVGRPLPLSSFMQKVEGKPFETQLEALADEVGTQLQRNVLVMNTTLIATLMLLNQSDVTFAKFFRQLETLQECVSALGGKLNKNSEDELVLRSFRFFEFMEVDRTRKMIVMKSEMTTPNVFRLLYYRNFAFHLFVKDALLVLVVKSGIAGPSPKVPEIGKFNALVADLLAEESYRLTLDNDFLLEHLQHNALGIFEIEECADGPRVM